MRSTQKNTHMQNLNDWSTARREPHLGGAHSGQVQSEPSDREPSSGRHGAPAGTISNRGHRQASTLARQTLVERHQALIKSKTKQRRGYVTVAVFGFLGLMSLLAVKFWDFQILLFPLFLWMFIWGIYKSNRCFVTRREYASLGGLDLVDGCIYCGHKGIYRHGVYRSDRTVSDCSKCGQTLFSGVGENWS